MEIGQTLGHYTILEKLGAGGMGEVYLAEDTTLKRRVALKVLPAELAANRERLERFQREAETLAALDHPNIVTIHTVEEAEGVRFLTMQLVEGQRLTDLIPKGGMSLDRIFDIAIPLADALAAAHEKGVIHRDLKPANIIVTDESRVKVLDFGLAKLAPPGAAEGGETAAPTMPLETEPGTVLGTVGYMSPEQVRGEPIDRRSDIFSLGSVLYEMAGGERAFDAQSAPDVMSAILRDDPPSVDELRPDLPHHLGRVIRRCLKKLPDRRYQSAQEIRNELEDLSQELDRQGILESRPGPAVPTAKPRRLRLGVALVGAVAVIIALAVAYRLVRRGVDVRPATDRARIASLAVLPFDNLMNDPEQDYFVEGMHEALITDLSKIGTLRVISRTSAMRYTETDKSLPQIAQELDVDALIEGSVLRADGQVRITAQLVDGETDEHLWADSYDRELENVLALLSELARAIAGEIEITVAGDQERRLNSVHPVNPEAYELYLRGQYHFNQVTVEGFRQALDFHRQAVELDPDFAAGWAALSGSYLLHGFFDLAPAAEMIPKARAAARRALELDDDQGSAHSALGYIALYFDWDWPTAKREVELGIELDSTNTMAYHAYADYLGVMGECDQSVEQVRRGRQYDPMGAWANIFVVGHLIFCKHYEEAVEEGRRAADLGMEVEVVREWVGFALWLQGRYEEALAEWRDTFGADNPQVQIFEHGYAEGGPRGALLARAESLAAAADSRPVNPYDVAAYYAAAEQADAAFEWLETAFDRRTPQLLHMAFDPFLNPIRDDPRFADLLQRIGIPE